jgi:hypothetical protein
METRTIKGFRQIKPEIGAWIKKIEEDYIVSGFLAAFNQSNPACSSTSVV